MANAERMSTEPATIVAPDELATASRVSARWRGVVATAVIALAVWLPRGFALDRFVTVDESRWLIRSANFYQALYSGNLTNTYQHGHPGVIIMLAGMAGYLTEFPDYPTQVKEQLVWSDPAIQQLESLGHRPIDLIAAGRVFIVLLNVVALTLAFLYTRRLIGQWAAFVAFLLIAFDPFHVAISRFLHPDSLLSTFMLLATVALMAYLFAGRRTSDLVATGIYTALAWLTKTPAIFLLPLVGLLTLIELAATITSQPDWHWRYFVRRAALWRLLQTWLVWGGVTALVYVALWPAMWVAPLTTLSQVLSISSEYATEGHSSAVFFNGRIYNGDPGFWFYPVNYLWRTTPTVLIGLVVLVGALARRASVARRRIVLLTVLGLLASAFFFNLFMTLGAKKFDRYLLPIFPVLDMAAAIGWSALAAALVAWRGKWGQRIAGSLVAAAILWQAGLSLSTYPYYLSYYNPLLGGAERAEAVMQIGWGEGLDEAARYLNSIGDPTATTVSSWYERGPFSFFYAGTSTTSRYLWESDYAVVYNHQWQRELPSRRMLAYFDTLTPLRTVYLDGIDYVDIYDLADAPLPDYAVRWGEGIELLYYDATPGNLASGHLFEMTMFFRKIAPLPVDYHVKVEIMNADGYTLLRQEGKPQGVNTTEWAVGDVIIDDSIRLTIPTDAPTGLYRIEVSFYDPETLDVLPAVQMNNGRLLGSPYVLDYVVRGEWPASAQTSLTPPVELGEMVEVTGATLVDANGDALTPGRATFAPGARIDLRVLWRARQFIDNDYTTFVHVVGPDGTLVAQADRPPLDGFVPTSYWVPRQEFADSYPVQLPADALAGEYRVLLGWYDLATLARLPVTQGDDALGDAYQVASFVVQ